MSPTVRPLADEMILIDSELGKRFGFTSDKFLPMSYLWGKGTDVIVSFIASAKQGKGHFRALVDRIQSLGYRVLVPTPLPQMEMILRKWGWIEDSVWDEQFKDYVSLWRRAG